MRDRIAAWERCEAGAWADFFRGADARAMDEAGLRVDELGGAVLTMATKADVLAFNRVLGVGLSDPVTPEFLDAVTERFRDAGVPRFFFPVSPAAQPEFPERLLLDAGYTHYNNWVRLVRSTASAPDKATDLQIRRIGSEHAEDFGRTMQEVFEWTEGLRGLISATVGRPGFHQYIAFDGDTPAATAGFYVQGDVAWFDFAATREEYRGRGAQSALIAQRLRDAADLGCTEAIVEVAEPKPDKRAQSYRNIRRLGFEIAHLRPNYIRFTAEQETQ